MIPTLSPIAIIAVTNNAGNPQFQTNVPHTMTTGNTGTVEGCRNSSGALVAGYNTAAVVTVVDAYNFTIGTAYVGGSPGYDHGGAVWPVGAEMTSAELTAFDAVLPVRVTDKTGDTIVGQYTFSGTPGVSMTDPSSQVVTNSPGSQIATPNAGVPITLGDGDDVVLSPPRTRTILVSMTEAMNEYGSDGIQFGQQLTSAMSVVSTNNGSTSAVQVFWLPLSRLHDKATLLRATLYFLPSPYNGTTAYIPPKTPPTLQLFRINPSTDITLTSLAANGPAVFPALASTVAYGVTPPIPATGFVSPSFLTIGETVKLTAGQSLSDSAGNLFKVSTSGNYTASTPVPVVGVAPPTGTFYAANGNLAGGTLLSWATVPAGLGPTAAVTPAAARTASTPSSSSSRRTPPSRSSTRARTPTWRG